MSAVALFVSLGVRSGVQNAKLHDGVKPVASDNDAKILSLTTDPADFQRIGSTILSEFEKKPFAELRGCRYSLTPLLTQDIISVSWGIT